MSNFRILAAVIFSMTLAMQAGCSEEEAAPPTKKAKSAKRSVKKPSKPVAKPAPTATLSKAGGSLWVGIKHQDVDAEAAKDAGLKKATGALVVGVTDGGPGAGAGVREDDVIVAVDGAAVKSSAGLLALLKKVKAGKTIQVTLWRDGNKKVLPVITKARP